jgi:hypothetical protein
VAIPCAINGRLFADAAVRVFDLVFHVNAFLCGGWWSAADRFCAAAEQILGFAEHLLLQNLQVGQDAI